MKMNDFIEQLINLMYLIKSSFKNLCISDDDLTNASKTFKLQEK